MNQLSHTSIHSCSSSETPPPVPSLSDSALFGHDFVTKAAVSDRRALASFLTQDRARLCFRATHSHSLLDWRSQSLVWLSGTTTRPFVTAPLSCDIIVSSQSYRKNTMCWEKLEKYYFPFNEKTLLDKLYNVQKDIFLSFFLFAPFKSLLSEKLIL